MHFLTKKKKDKTMFNSMYDNINRMVGNIKIEEISGGYRVTGVASWKLQRALQQVWGTAKVANNIIKTPTSGSFTVKYFFVPDVIYCLEKMLEQRHIRYFNRREAEAVLILLRSKTWAQQFTSEQKKIVKPNWDNLKKFRSDLRPLPHQKEYIEHYHQTVSDFNLKGHLLAAGVGAGKTLNSLFLMETLGMDTVIIITPLHALISVWQETLETCFVEKPNYWITAEKTLPRPNCKYYVFHYEQLSQAVDWFKKYKPNGKLGIIIDESHNLNEIKSMRTQKLVELVQVSKSSNTLFMSGTPIKAMATEVVPLLRSIDPLFNQRTEDTFLEIFGKSTIRALDIMQHRLGMVSFKVAKEQYINFTQTTWDIRVRIPDGEKYLLKNVREEIRKFVTERMKYYEQNFQMYEDDYNAGVEVYAAMVDSPAEKEEFKKYQSYIKTIRKGYDPATMGDMSLFCNKFEKDEIMPRLSPNHRHKFRKAKSVVKYVNFTILGEALGSVLGKIRMQCNVDIALNLYDVICTNRENPKDFFKASITDLIDDAEKKTIFFSSFVEVVDELAAHLKEKDYHPLRVHGETNKDLPQIVKTFFNDPKANPLIATYQSLSSAVPLICANRSIMLNMPYRPHEYTQATGRVARLGQDRHVDIFDVTADTGHEPNISTRSKDIMQWALENVQVMMGDKTLNLTVTEGIDERPVNAMRMIDDVGAIDWANIDTNVYHSHGDDVAMADAVMEGIIESCIKRGKPKVKHVTNW